MQQIYQVDLHRTPLSSEQISHWLMSNKDLRHYTPLNRDSIGPYSFSLRAVDGFASWNASSGTSRRFDVGVGGDNFMFFFEKSTSYAIESGSARHGANPRTGVLISAERYSGIDVAASSVGEGFVVSRKAVVSALASSYERAIPRDFEFAPALDLHEGPMVRILALMNFFRDNVLSQPDLVVSPLAVASFQEMLCQLMIENLQHSCSGVDRLSSGIAPYQVKRARDFVRANAHLPITVADMAAAAGVSARALQTNFRTFLDTTPMAYLRHVRLEGVRRDLQSASPAATTIAEVARRWGFVHMGRFAQDYSASFGVKPSEDLGRRFDPRGSF
ncbi:helix-turn-helix domain-containing protein [Rhizobium sp. TRM95111]|uniref:helix-turn-helix domain-containing protein n=1 Tax=Rhizobium alarense TaxID=2846851 RepID=UPI001F3B83C0|nr:helix-turn-helix domain-containing protein [Rhizobium alarense]MCF3640481.1 helix-turn-helix domain-containing protein [Rhizobium alarense]